MWFTRGLKTAKGSRAAVLAVCLLLFNCGGGGGSGGERPPIAPAPAPGVPGSGPGDCVDGAADGFACRGIRLRQHLALADFGGTRGNDIWGWADLTEGREYALTGLSDGVAFVDVTDPDAPVVIGVLPTATVSSTWRDIKVYANHAFVVADAAGAHGMQVFDLRRLRGSGTGQRFSPDHVYVEFGSAHNVAINEASGFAYVVGSDTCGGGLHMIDVSVPVNPLFAGCHSADGDTHDAQCVTYLGPDADHSGSEVCVGANENIVAVIDVTNKSATLTLARFSYPQLGFVHQNWLSEDHRFLFLGDEADEVNSLVNTRTLIFDMTDLDAPSLLHDYRASTIAIDHNMFVRGNRLYQANYEAGLRVLEFSDLLAAPPIEIAFFDTSPGSDEVSFGGAWGVYPYLPSGVLLVSDVQRGLFVLSHQ